MGQPTIFAFISSILLALIAYIIPKKMKPYEIYTTSLFAIAFGLIVDTVIAVKYKLYVLDEPGIQIPALLAQVILYSSTSIILLNLYPYDKSLKWKAVHIIGFTLFALAFEYISYEVGFIKYNEWNMWYSAICYPFLVYFLVFHYEFFKWLVKRHF
jgi:hypothetical protein